MGRFNRKRRIYAGVAGLSLIFILAVWYFLPGKAPSNAQQTRGKLRANFNAAPNLTGKTLADVPLFKLPWKNEPDIDAMIAGAAKSNSVASTVPAIKFPAQAPAGNAIATFVPKFSAPTTKQAVVKLDKAITFEPLNAPQRSKQELLTLYLQQLTGNTAPTLEDWKILAGSRPQGLAKEDLPPVGPGRFITGLCRDQQGKIWIGCEDEGVWRYDQQADLTRQWQQFTRKNTGGPDEPHGPDIESGNWLGDDNGYAIACDKFGRIWVGHRNHGVSVYNGKSWKNYGVFQGPIGERVFAIATCPTDGDVWIATNAGVTRYSLAQDTWRHYTQAEGLPSDHISAIAFDDEGNIIIGTQCDGLILAAAKDAYTTWKRVAYYGGKSALSDELPVNASDSGLPANLINDILVARDGTIYVATTAGVAWSSDRGETWQHVRGQDYAAKVRMRVGGAPANWRPGPGAIFGEDYATCLSEDAQGRIHVGHRNAPTDIVSPRVQKLLDKIASDYTSAILPPYYASYGNGLKLTSTPPDAISNTAEREASMPTAAKTASNEELLRLLTNVRGLTPIERKEPVAVALSDDWRTRGDWIDRYGRFAGVLCAMGGQGNDLVCGYRGAWFERRGWMGANNLHPSDQLRYWVEWDYTDDPRVLQNEMLGRRRQSEWDDHGESLPMTLDGPHVYATFKIPKGQYLVSAYFMNKDGHGGSNRWRDFVLDLRQTSMDRNVFDPLGLPKKDAEAIFRSSASLARSRVKDFWGGVYKTFYVNSPSTDFFTLKVDRNYSYCTILSAIFIDPVGELCGPQGPEAQPAPRRSALFSSPPTDTAGIALALMDALLVQRDSNPEWYAVNGRRMLLPLLQRLLERDQNGGCLAEAIYQAQRHPNFPEDLAACLRDARLFAKRDEVLFPKDAISSYHWAGRTAVTSNPRQWRGNPAEAEQFIQKKRTLNFFKAGVN